MLAIAVSRSASQSSTAFRLDADRLGGKEPRVRRTTLWRTGCSAPSRRQASTRLRVFPARAAVDALPAVRCVGERPYRRYRLA